MAEVTSPTQLAKGDTVYAKIYGGRVVTLDVTDVCPTAPASVEVGSVEQGIPTQWVTAGSVRNTKDMDEAGFLAYWQERYEVAHTL